MAAALGMLGGAFGNAEFKKIISGGLKNDYAKRIKLEEILDMDWFKEISTELKVNAEGVSPPAKKY